MGGEEGLSPLLILARCFLADPGPGGTDPLWAGPVAPRLIPSPGRAHKGRRSPSPAQPSPALPPPAPRALPDPPQRSPPGMVPRIRRPVELRGHGDNTDTAAAVAQLRAAAQPRPRGGRAGTFLLVGRSPLTPSRSPCRPSTHRGRPERVPARTERGGRRRAQTPQRLPRPPPAPSPYTPTSAERHLLYPINTRRHIATRR